MSGLHSVKIIKGKVRLYWFNTILYKTRSILCINLLNCGSITLEWGCFFYESFNNVIKRHHLSLSKTLKDECFPFIPVKTIQSISVYQRVKIAEATLQANNTDE